MHTDMKRRSIVKITQNPWNNGFLGPGHQAKAVLDGVSREYRDPFILFMDDRLDLPGGDPVGGPHPHAGFETLTLVLEGNGKDWQTGSFEIMTAGKGIVHTEEIETPETLHILQVWLALPPEKRYEEPRLQRILLEDVPKIKTEKSEIRVYSGYSNGLHSPIQNHTPLTLVDFYLQPGATVYQALPAHYNGFIYVLDGAVKVGDQLISDGQTGWFEKWQEEGESEVTFEATESATHFVLYAGKPHHAPLVQHGPFVADSMDDISQMYRKFRLGLYPHVNDLPSDRVIEYQQHNRAEGAVIL